MAYYIYIYYKWHIICPEAKDYNMLNWNPLMLSNFYPDHTIE